MKSKANIVVGVNTSGYPERRNIIDPKPANVQLKQVKDSMKGLDYLYFKTRKKNHPFFHNVFYDLGMNQVDLYHFFNVVSLGKRPWVVTYENELPRHNHDSAYLAKKLAGRSCKKIIALSHNAHNVERFFLKKFPQQEEKILEKIVVLHPPQQLFTESIDTKRYIPGKVRFVFVGGAFFHKGGKEMLSAFIRLIQQYPQAHLTVVSSFSFNQWYDTEYGPADADLCRKSMSNHPDQITYHAQLPNAEVIALLQHSDVALLPSFGETFGYSVLEAQACGCPVITTNAWAFPEFNSNNTGWLLDLPLTTVNGGLRSDIATTEKKKFFSALMEEKLYETMKEICESPDRIQPKAEACIQQIRERHSVKAYSNKLEHIYQEALSQQA